MSGATTTIRVPIGTRSGVEWDVPRGFGAAYRRAAKLDLACVGDGKPGEVIGGIISVLALIGYAATHEQVATWDLRRRVEAMIYAATEHARAGDNPVQRHPRPSWLPERPWQGPRHGSGAFAGPSPTAIP